MQYQKHPKQQNRLGGQGQRNKDRHREKEKQDWTLIVERLKLFYEVRFVSHLEPLVSPYVTFCELQADFALLLLPNHL